MCHKSIKATHLLFNAYLGGGAQNLGKLADIILEHPRIVY